MKLWEKDNNDVSVADMWSVIALVATLAALTCPAQAQMGRRRYCGSTLADMLSLVCGGRFYSGSEKRSRKCFSFIHFIALVLVPLHVHIDSTGTLNSMHLL